MKVCRRYFIKEAILKTFKRIMAIILLIVTVLAVSYLAYTAKQNQPEAVVSEVLYEVAKTT